MEQKGPVYDITDYIYRRIDEFNVASGNMELDLMTLQTAEQIVNFLPGIIKVWS